MKSYADFQAWFEGDTYTVITETEMRALRDFFAPQFATNARQTTYSVLHQAFDWYDLTICRLRWRCIREGGHETEPLFDREPGNLEFEFHFAPVPEPDFGDAIPF